MMTACRHFFRECWAPTQMHDAELTLHRAGEPLPGAA